MGKIQPIKQFQYVLEVNNIEQFYFQEITTPDITVDEVEHGEGNRIYRTPGMVRIGDMTLSKLIASDTAEQWALDWLNSAQNVASGVGGLPSAYLQTVTIRLRDNAGNTIKTMECGECWLKQKSGVTLSSTTSDNVLEEAMLVVNTYEER